MAKRSPLVGIIMGSQSDWATLRHAAETLDALGVPHEARIVSAHRTPKRMYGYAEGARGRGLRIRCFCSSVPYFSTGSHTRLLLTDSMTPVAAQHLEISSIAIAVARLVSPAPP